MKGQENQEAKKENMKKKKKEKKKSLMSLVVEAGRLREQKKKRSKIVSKQPEDSFDISREVDLMIEIKDIRDELNILSNLFDQQKSVLESFTRFIGKMIPAHDAADNESNANTIARTTPSLLGAINRQIEYVKRMNDDADRPYQRVSHTKS
jgi:hypothetical protein